MQAVTALTLPRFWPTAYSVIWPFPGQARWSRDLSSCNGNGTAGGNAPGTKAPSTPAREGRREAGLGRVPKSEFSTAEDPMFLTLAGSSGPAGLPPECPGPA